MVFSCVLEIPLTLIKHYIYWFKTDLKIEQSIVKYFSDLYPLTRLCCHQWGILLPTSRKFARFFYTAEVVKVVVICSSRLHWNLFFFSIAFIFAISFYSSFAYIFPRIFIYFKLINILMLKKYLFFFSCSYIYFIFSVLFSYSAYLYALQIFAVRKVLL